MKLTSQEIRLLKEGLAHEVQEDLKNLRKFDPAEDAARKIITHTIEQICKTLYRLDELDSTLNSMKGNGNA